jgi:uncharacterized protein (TIGR04255 family)
MDFLMSDLRSSDHRFRSPPVVESALAVQFEEISLFRTVHFGLFHQAVRDQFPVAEDQSRAEAIFETFPIVPRPLGLKLIQKSAAPERVFFRDSTDGSRLIQLQPDRFGFNWRRTVDEERYPTFGEIGPLFLNEFQKFKDFCEQEGLGKLRPNLCEVVYVNHVFRQDPESAVECMERILSGVSLRLDNGLPTPELAAYNRVYPIGDRKGRLYAEATIGRHHVNGDFVILKLTARIVLTDGDNLAANIQLAHDSVVNGFVAITNPATRQQVWGQVQ